MKKIITLIRKILGIEGIATQLRYTLEAQKQLITQQNQIIRNTKVLSLVMNTSAKNRIFYLSSPEHGNLGDQAISAAAIDLLKKLYPEYSIVDITYNDWLASRDFIIPLVNSVDIITIHGGGNFGNLWIHEEEARQDIVSSFPLNQIISLPQSITFTDDEDGYAALEKAKKIYNNHKNLTIMTRGEISFQRSKEYFPNVTHVLAPDCVMFWEEKLLDHYQNNNREGILFALRSDKEKASDDAIFKMIENFAQKHNIPTFALDTVIAKEDIFPHDREVLLNSLLENFGNARLIITDRLHGMIFSMLTSTPCIVFPSIDHKIKECSAWLEHLEWIHFNSPIGEIEQLIKEYVIEEKRISHEEKLTTKTIAVYQDMLNKK
ncbi:MAG: polysaccharide pyruvyl transferase family protein [Brevinema sp.]